MKKFEEERKAFEAMNSPDKEIEEEANEEDVQKSAENDDIQVIDQTEQIEPQPEEVDKVEE